MELGGALDRIALAVSPRWGLERMRARVVANTIARHYDAAAPSRRTQNWSRWFTDANAAQRGAIANLRFFARDLVRNNAWARQALQVIGDNTVGWGILGKPRGGPAGAAARFAPLWRAWGDSTECDADGRLNFAGIQALAIRTIAESGEVLVRRRWRREGDGLTLPFALHVLEPDFLDVLKDGFIGETGGPTIQGVEFDAIGRRTAYWLFPRHPGAWNVVVPPGGMASKRVSAKDVIHVYRTERPGQVRGSSWFAAAIVALKDFDDFEDATLLRQKIAACFAAFVRDVDGAGPPIGEQDPTNPLIETLEPGLVSHLPPGQDIVFANPPGTTDDGFSTRSLRRIAAALAITYEDLTGDYSQVNFSSARMARLKHYAAVHSWRWNMLIPQLCDPVFAWALEAATVDPDVRATWTPPPMPMIEPDKEGLALARMVRTGAKTFSEMVREQGVDPDEHFAEYASDLARLDRLGITLDSDARKTTQAGLAQTAPAEEEGEPPPSTPKNGKPMKAPRSGPVSPPA